MATDPVHIPLRRPAETAAVVPYLLGFHPTDSLIVLGLHEQRIICGARVDLPHTAADDPPFRDACDTLAAHLHRRGATAALLLGYGVTFDVAHAGDLAREALGAHAIGVRDVLRVADGRVWTLSCTDPACCPLAGVPVAVTGVAATTAVYAGRVAWPDRAAMAAQLDPVTGVDRWEFAEATVQACERLVALMEATGADDLFDTDLGRLLVDAGGQLIDEALQVYRAGHRLGLERAAPLTVLLNLPQITQAAVQRTDGEPWQIDMWADLVRRSEAEFRPGCAVPLTFAALQAGNHPLARLAVEQALQIDPEHQLVALLHRLVQLGVDPDTAARIAHT